MSHNKIANKYLSKLDEYIANTDKEDNLKIIEEMEANGLIENTLKSTQFNFVVLTKEQVEEGRCKAYNYLI